MHIHFLNRMLVILVLYSLLSGCETTTTSSGSFTSNGIRSNTIEQLLAKADDGDANAQCELGTRYYRGQDVRRDYKKAASLFSQAAEQGLPKAQYNLGVMYDNGQGVLKNHKEAVKWYSKAAEQGYGEAQYNLGLSYAKGEGTIEHYVEAYKWMLLAGMNGVDTNDVEQNKAWLRHHMTTNQVAEAQNRAKSFIERENKDYPSASTNDNEIKTFGTGFFISRNGYFVTAAHVVKNAKSVQISWRSKDYSAEMIFADEILDVAVLKVDGIQSPQVLSLSSSSTVKTGDAVFTLGFPQVQFQGIEPKYTDGAISSLSGMANDPKYFQISVPVQPGNSGGPLLDSQGRVVGLINSRLDDINTLLETGSIPQNVNYALKSSFIVPLLESLPDIQLEKPAELDKAAAIEKAKNAVGLVVCVE